MFIKKAVEPPILAAFQRKKVQIVLNPKLLVMDNQIKITDNSYNCKNYH